jgi:hypothetical protein
VAGYEGRQVRADGGRAGSAGGAVPVRRIRLLTVAVAWQFSGSDPEARERRALKAIAISFFALAIYVTGEAVSSFFTGAAPETSRTGIVLAAISLAVMPALSAAQYLSAVLLAGLLLNALFGWRWADPPSRSRSPGWR